MFQEKMTDTKSDSQLIEEFISGSDIAFNLLAKRYQQKIYWHARRMTGNHLDADEIVQQVLLVMFNKLKTFNFQSSVYTWIYKITSTRSLNLLRRNKVRSLFSIEDKAGEILKTENDIISDLENKEKIEKIQQFLLKIPAKQREVFILRNFDELSYDEISEITGRSVGALKANYFHAFNKLKDLMKNEKL